MKAAIGVGDLGLAYQAFKISISCDNTHAESYSNLGVLELRKNNIEQVVELLYEAQIRDAVHRHAATSFKQFNLTHMSLSLYSMPVTLLVSDIHNVLLIYANAVPSYF